MINETQAMEAIDRLDVLTFFGNLSGPAKAEVAKLLMNLVNWPESKRRYDNSVDPPRLLPYVEPEVRLNRLVNVLINHVGTWPGPAEVRAIYCKMYPPADGIDGGSSITPGFTDDECEARTDLLSLNRPPEPKYLPQPGDESCDDLKALIEKTAAAKAIR